MRRMADRLAGGQLDELLREGRAAGKSYAQLSRDLFAAYGIEASGETLRQWAPDTAEAAS